ncbi:MAG: hypothetical protein HUJ76_00630, partial [Parasporobacterium sp.]|nr:hypothetical protein [Parasporobacterium sp.]
GNCCKDCASKLSPWFSERRHSTIESIKEQLAYREANKAEVESFNVTRTIGTGTRVLIDENQKKFIITSSKKWRDENPDVLSFSSVTGCDTFIDENKSEIMNKDKDGNSVSFRPPHFRYTYIFFVTIHVNNPYFDDIKFRLNSFSVDEEAVGPLLRHGSEYEGYAASLEEIKSIFTDIREDTRAASEAAAAPKVPVKCPACGATTLPDARGCCEFCGSAL